MSLEQLLELGYTRRMIQGRGARGQLIRIHRGVYAVGHGNLSIRGRWMAAVLACGHGTVLSHRDAAALHDLRPIGSGPIHVTAPSPRQIPGVRCHRARDLDPADVVIVDDIPVTTVERTLLDLAETDSGQHLRWALEQAQRQDKLNFGLLQAVIARNPGRHGIKPLQEAMNELADEPEWTQSWLERAFREITRAENLPEPEFNVYVEGELVDAVWREQNLVVEVDGWKFHKTKRSFEDDRRKDAKLVVRHWRVVRFTYNRVRYDRAGVAGELSELLRGAPAQRRARSGP